MTTLIQLIKMFKFKNLLLCGLLMAAGSAFAQTCPFPPCEEGGGSPNPKFLMANTDTLSVTNPNGGSVNVFANDTADSVVITPLNLQPMGDLTVSLTNNAGLAGVTLDGTNGILTVLGSPAAGSYILNYQVCQPLFPGNCSTGTVNLTVTAGNAAMVATTDQVDIWPNTTDVNVLTNDTVNGSMATSATAAVTIVSDGGLTGLSVNGSGQLVVPLSRIYSRRFSPTYQICEVGNLTNCSTTVTVNIDSHATLVNNPDTSIAFTTAGGSFNLLANDTYNGAVATTSTVFAGYSGLPYSAPAQLYIENGMLVATPLPAGTYTYLRYRICELPALIANYDCTADVALNVTVTDSTLVATADSATIAPSTTNVTVLTNDTVNGLAATTSNSVVTIVSDGGLTGLSVSSGQLVVPARAAGTYSPTYKICISGAPLNCSNNATVTITAVAGPVAAADAGSVVSGTGGTVNILANDTFNGVAATTTNVLPSIVMPVTGFSIVSGQLSVATTVVAGSYPVTYKICEAGNPTNCSGTVTATVTVTAPLATMVAVADTASIPPIATTVPVLSNDTVNGVTATTTNAAVTIVSDGGLTGLSVNGSGQLVVPARAPSTSASPTYKICEVGNLANCSSTVAVTLTTLAGPIAAQDTFSLPDGAGGTLNILANDTFNGAPATSSNVTATIVSASPGTFTINGSGQLVVSTSAIVNTNYAVTYKICDNTAPSSCSANAYAYVYISPLTISAVADTGSVVAGLGGTVNILANDTFNGAAATTATVTPSIPVAVIGFSINGSGQMAVASTVAPGSYPVTYKICQTSNPTNCSQEVVAGVTVSATTIIAVADSVTLSQVQTLVTVLGNDFVGPAIPATTGTAIVTIVSDGGLTGLSVNGSGQLVVPTRAGGTYTPTYKICEVASPTNCSTPVAVTITAAAAPAVLVANTDSVSVVSGTGGTLNILANDTRNTVLAPTTTQVEVTIVSGLVAGITHTGGVLTIATTVAAGAYPVTYKICEMGNLTNCSATATATVTTTAAVPTLTAVADGGSVVAGTGVTFSILNNDTVTTSGVTATATTSNVAVTDLSGLVAGITHNGSGQLTIATTLAAGTYPLTYKICQVGNLTNCSATATVTVTLTPAIPTLTAVADTGSVVSGTGGTVNILTNDTVTTSGISAAATTSNVEVTIVSGLVTGITYNGSGLITIATSTAANAYPVIYKICQIGNTANCSANATATITVTAAPVVTANADSVSVVAGVSGTLNILTNDTLGAAVATSSNVTVTLISTLPTGISHSGGVLTVATSAAAGSYAVTYKICQVGNLTNCSVNATATVIVTAAPVAGGAGLVLAIDAITMPVTGGSLNVLANDRFNTAAIPASSVILTLTDNPVGPSATLSALGDLFIPTGLTQGIKLFTYKVCLVSAPTTCATSTASINISAAVTSSVRVIPSVPGATSSNVVVTTTSQPVMGFSTGGSSGSSTAGGGSINDPLTFIGARVSFGERMGGLTTIDLYSSQDIPSFVTLLNYNGSGTMNGSWLVVRPGEQIPSQVDLLPEAGLTVLQRSQRRPYTSIGRVSSYMAPTGSSLIQGPDVSRLPKSIQGTYYIFLRLEGAGTASMPMLRYRILGDKPPAPRATTTASAPIAAQTPTVTIASINTTAPNAGAVLQANGIGAAINFAWTWDTSQSTATVTSWRIEVRQQGAQSVTKILSTTTGTQRQMRGLLDAATYGGKSWSWRLIGIDNNRQVIARSADMFFSVVAPATSTNLRLNLDISPIPSDSSPASSIDTLKEDISKAAGTTPNRIIVTPVNGG